MSNQRVPEQQQNQCSPGKVYISFYAALNMIDPSGNSGDWHSYTLRPENLRYAGEGCDVNTLPWLQDKGLITYPAYDSLPQLCLSRNHWIDLQPPFIVANHRRAAVDLLYQDFVLTRNTRGRTVDMYGWIDTDEAIQAIFDDFQLIVDDLSTTPLKVDPADWRNYQNMIWEMAA